jgi:hypothetical protein
VIALATFTVNEPYRPRDVRFRGLHEWRGWRLKEYSVVYAGAALDRDMFAEGLALALPTLPRPAVTLQRPGVGFVILHQGRGISYLVVGWWDRENEIFSRTFWRPFGADSLWREGTSGETACVWDLQVFWFEREAYLRHVLARAGVPDLDGYLGAHFGSPAA